MSTSFPDEVSTLLGLCLPPLDRDKIHELTRTSWQAALTRPEWRAEFTALAVTFETLGRRADFDGNFDHLPDAATEVLAVNVETLFAPDRDTERFTALGEILDAFYPFLNLVE